MLATNGQSSIAIFNYAENGINWPGGVGGRAVAGYNVGDNDRHFKLPGSLSEDIQNIDNTTGNTGRDGQWVFLLSGESHIHVTMFTHCTVYAGMYILSDSSCLTEVFRHPQRSFHGCSRYNRHCLSSLSPLSKWLLEAILKC